MSSTVRYVIYDHRPLSTVPKPTAVQSSSSNIDCCLRHKRSFDFRRSLKMSEDTTRLHLDEIHGMVAPSCVEILGRSLLPSVDGLAVTKTS